MERIDESEESVTTPLGTYYSKHQMRVIFVCGAIIGVILSYIAVLIEQHYIR